MSTTYNTVKLKGDPCVEDVPAAGAITPGMLCLLGSGGTVTAYPTGGGSSGTWVALERDEVGKGVTDDYSSGQLVKIGKFATGMAFAGLLMASENVAVGDILEAGGTAGMLRKAVADTSAGTIVVGSRRFMAREASNVGTTARIHVEVV